MSSIDSKIVSFITKHSILTLATSFGDEPYCANLFYAYLPEDGCLVITSDKNTRHIRDISHNIFVAGSIIETNSLDGWIRGVQFQGVISEPSTGLLSKAEESFFRLFPAAKGMQTTFWVIDLTLIKYTDSSLGFGKKLTWKK